MVILFWVCAFIIFYTFIGYGLLLFLIIKVKSIFYKKKQGIINNSENYQPTCSIIIAAYNEELFIRDKILNTLSQNYPSHLSKILIVTDGSTDKTNQIIEEYPLVKLFHSPVRNGKIDAINRIIPFVDSEIIVLTDANTFLNEGAITKICQHYLDPNIGGVAGEKRIFVNKNADVTESGESFYWKYESKLKQWDSELNTTIGAAGELFSIRTKLYQSVPKNIILDDFMISMKIVQKGYKIIYEPEAYAIETASSNIKEELKRKIRIAAGGIQSIIKLKHLLNPFKYPLLSFQFFSHRVLRWSITPFFLITIFIVNISLYLQYDYLIYKIFLFLQISFYSLAALGYIAEKGQINLKVTYIPYYFCIMNYAVILGIYKFIRGQQNSLWEKAKRKI